MTYMWHFPVFDVEDASPILRCNSETPPVNERSAAYPIPSPEAVYVAKAVATAKPSAGLG